MPHAVIPSILNSALMKQDWQCFITSLVNILDLFTPIFHMLISYFQALK